MLKRIALGPLRKLVADLCASAPPALVGQALHMALAQEGDYQDTDPARLLARLIEDAFAGGHPTVEQVERVTRAVEAWHRCPECGVQIQHSENEHAGHCDLVRALLSHAQTDYGYPFTVRTAAGEFTITEEQAREILPGRQETP